MIQCDEQFDIFDSDLSAPTVKPLAVKIRSFTPVYILSEIKDVNGELHAAIFHAGIFYAQLTGIDPKT